MTIAKPPTELPFEAPPSAYSIYKRLANLALAVIAVAISVNLWLLSTDQAQNWHTKQANQLGRSLANLGAQVLIPAMRQQDMTLLGNQLTALADDPHVVGVAVFNDKGQVVDSSNARVSLLATYQLDKEKPLVFVAEIREAQKILGYLRVLLNEDAVMQYHSDYQAQLIQQQIVLTLLGCAGGILLARAFYKFRFRHHQKPQSTPDTPNNA